MYIRNISRHDFLLKVVTKKLWKILQQKNIVKTGKKIGVKKKKKEISQFSLPYTKHFLQISPSLKRI